MREQLLGFIDRFIPAEAAADEELQRRARLLVGGTLLFGVIGFIFFLNTVRLASSQLVNYLSVGGAAVVMFSTPWIMRWTKKVRVAGAWATGWLTLALTALALSGGFDAPALWWLTLLPILAWFLVHRSFALVVAVWALAVGTGIYLLTHAGHHFPISYSGDNLTHLTWLSFVFLVVTSTTLAGLYDLARSRALAMQRQTNDFLKRARDDADAANRAKSAFLATVSHELRTPLHGILAMTDMLEREVLPPPLTEQVAIAGRSARALDTLIADLLHLSEFEAGAVRLDPRPMAMRELCTNLETTHSRDAELQGLELSCIIEDSVPERLMIDPVRLGQIAHNLVGNAVKFTDSGEVVIEVRWLADEETLEMRVRDTGPGIPPQSQELIFQPFERGDVSSTRRHGGTGLGLTICRRIARRMGGSLDLDSAPGSGSTFTLRIPCQPPTPDQLAEHAPSDEAVHSVTDDQLPRVLVVDDNEICREVLGQLLGELHCRSDAVVDGERALEALGETDYDLVLMDCEMPVLDGLAATRALRQQEQDGGRSRVPVIAVTAHAGAHREPCLEAGMDNLIGKPFRLVELDRCLTKWLRTSGEHRRVESPEPPES